MKWIWTLLLVTVGATSVFAQTNINRRQTASANGFIDIQVPNGSVQVVGLPNLEVHVQGQVFGGTIQLLGSDELTTLRLPQGRAHLTVYVPFNSRVEMRGDSLGVTVSEMKGILRLRTVQGSVQVSDEPREIQVDTQTGQVDLTVLGSRINVSSTQGDVVLRLKQADVNVSTVSGNVQVDGELVNGQFQSVSGDLSVIATASRVNVSSSSGSVALTLKGGEADVSTMSGHILAQGDRFVRGMFESYTGQIQFESGPEKNGRLQFKAHDGTVDLNVPGTSNDVVVTTQTGAIHVRGEDFDRGWIESRSGRVTFEGNVSTSGALDVQTDGSVELLLPETVDASFRIATEGGTIQNAFGISPDQGALDFKTGKGQAWINVKSRGDVWVRKRIVEQPEKPRSEADILFDQALALGDDVSVDDRLDAFRKVLRTDRTYAPAHHALAKLYMIKNTPTHRQWAQRALREAMRLDPDHVTYNVTMGDLMWAQGFWFNAEQQYEKVLKIEPQNAHAAYKIGQHKLINALKYSDMSYLDQTNSGGDSHWGEWKKWSEKDRVSAKAYLKQSIASDPTYRDAYYHLGLLYLESGRPDSFLVVSQQLLKQVPQDKDALLFGGLGAQRLGKMDVAFDFYSRALAQMSHAERQMMESVDLIATDEERADIARNKDGLDRFWRAKDPLFLTEYSEQRLEHYGRIAYANLRFSRPERQVAGWQTDMGKAYIKYGHFLARNTKRGDYAFDASVDQIVANGIDRSMAPLTFGAPSVTQHNFANQQIETWFYEDFQLAFQVSDGVTGDRISKEPLLARFSDPYQGVKYRMPFQASAFREQDSVRIELAYTLPKYKLGQDAMGQVELQDGVFVFDEAWLATYQDVSTARMMLPPSQDSTVSASDSLRQNNLLSMRQIRVPAGVYHVVAESRDPASGAIGTFRLLRKFGFSDTSLAASDLMLASQIASETPFPEVRNDLNIVPQPNRTFSQSEPVFVYLEMYNLTRNNFGKTDYAIAYRVGSPDEKEIDPALFMPVDYEKGYVTFEVEDENKSRASFTDQSFENNLQTFQDDQDKSQVVEGNKAQNEAWNNQMFQQGSEANKYRVKYVLPKSRFSESLQTVARQGVQMETVVTAEYEGQRRDDLTYLQVDVSQVPTGVHKLSVQIQDRNSGHIIHRSVLFRVIE
jgi:GWxTD domain-containing protein